MAVHRAVAEGHDPVITMVAALLHDGQAAAHGLTDADRHRLVHRRETGNQHAVGAHADE